MRCKTGLERFAAAVRWAAFGIGIMAGGATFAADPLVETSVTAKPDVVTLSRAGFDSFAAYEIKIVNNSRNVLNHVRFIGSTAVVGSGEAAPFVESIGGGCAAANAAKTAIDCNLGKLRSRGDSIMFTVVFKAPSTGSRVDFTWQGFYAEGLKDSDKAAHGDGTDVGVTSSALGTPVASEAKTFVPSGGGTVVTGTGVATSNDQVATTVSVPTSAVAQIVESVNPNSCSPDLLTCFFSDLTIPGRFANLVITLRRDASTIGSSPFHPPNIANAKVFYAADGVNFSEVLACSITGGPAPGAPCISTRKAYTSGDAPTPDFVGDWEFVIFAVDNGRYFL